MTMEIRVSPTGSEVVQRWETGTGHWGRWQLVGGTHDGELMSDDAVEGWTVLAPESGKLAGIAHLVGVWLRRTANDEPRLAERLMNDVSAIVRGGPVSKRQVAEQQEGVCTYTEGGKPCTCGGKWPLHQRPRQEGVTPDAEAVMVGPVDSGGHGAVQAELRQIQVAVRGQMDGIRPIEAVVLTYRWAAQHPHWVFEGLETLVQGLDGALKPGTPLSSEDFALLGPALGWAWDLVSAMRPRG